MALVPVLAFALVDEAEVPVPVVVDLLLLPVVEEDADGRFEPEEPDLDPELPVLLIPVLLPIDDESEDPDVLPDMEPELWFFSLSFIVKISWIYIVKK